MSQQVNEKCGLCHLQARLVNSHVIPNFHYKAMKGGENRFLVISTDPIKRETYRQKGITEYLLCSRCDNERLSKYEKHVREILFGGFPLDSKCDGRLLSFRGYDYKNLKNGLLSVLWRMSVSLDPFFREVDLGARHEERLREALLNDTEFEEEEYPILVTAPIFQGQALLQCMIPPDFTRAYNNRVYRCLISGKIFTFLVGSAPLAGTIRGLILRRKEWPVVRANVEELPFLSAAILQLGRASIIRNQAADRQAAQRSI